MRLFDFLRTKIEDLVFRLEFSEVSPEFTSKDKLFKLTFDENWVYSKKGNSFYSFHNMQDDLKGGLQFSIQWNVHTPDKMSEHEAIAHLINSEESEEVEFNERKISAYSALYYRINYDDSNMDFHNWIIYRNAVFILIKFMIFEEETDENKIHWFNRVTSILNSLELNEAKFQTTQMK